MEQDQEKNFEGRKALFEAGRVSTETIIHYSERDGKYRAIMQAMQHVASDLFEANDKRIISSAHLRNGITETVRAFTKTAYPKSGIAIQEAITQLIVLRIFAVYRQQGKEDMDMKEELANAL